MEDLPGNRVAAPRLRSQIGSRPRRAGGGQVRGNAAALSIRQISGSTGRGSRIPDNCDILLDIAEGMQALAGRGIHLGRLALPAASAGGCVQEAHLSHQPGGPIPVAGSGLGLLPGVGG